MTEKFRPDLEGLLKWLDMKTPTNRLGNCGPNEIFDLGQQISDDVKNKKLENGFVIYDNDGRIKIISIFRDKDKKPKMSKILLLELANYISKINRDD